MMNFFGLGPLEILFIIIIGLIVFGPEKLPEIGRFAGRQLAKLMAWQQQSPEAQMIQKIRQDFEQEIVLLRDELVRTRQQLDISTDVKQLHSQTQSLLTVQSSPSGTVAVGEAVSPQSNDSADSKERSISEAHERRQKLFEEEDLHSIAPPSTGSSLAEAPSNTVEQSPDDKPSVEEQSIASANGEHTEAITSAPATTLSPEASLASAAPSPDPIPTTNHLFPDDREMLLLQMQALMADLHALQEQLKARGLLDPDWKPPSHDQALPKESVSS
ncbi:MAG: twin-arginine translocase TatA/TatE family subunit [Chloroflexales bacterium]|nr:twin-arginine translocase TatA/TatE family subunit [Chloroflexales bacterium]